MLTLPRERTFIGSREEGRKVTQPRFQVVLRFLSSLVLANDHFREDSTSCFSFSPAAPVCLGDHLLKHSLSASQN